MFVKEPDHEIDVIIDSESVAFISKTLKEQGLSLQRLSSSIDEEQYKLTLNFIINCRGHVILCGMGKSGHVARNRHTSLDNINKLW